MNVFFSAVRKESVQTADVMTGSFFYLRGLAKSGESFFLMQKEDNICLHF